MQRFVLVPEAARSPKVIELLRPLAQPRKSCSLQGCLRVALGRVEPAAPWPASTSRHRSGRRANRAAPRGGRRSRRCRHFARSSVNPPACESELARREDSARAAPLRLPTRPASSQRAVRCRPVGRGSRARPRGRRGGSVSSARSPSPRAGGTSRTTRPWTRGENVGDDERGDDDAVDGGVDIPAVPPAGRRAGRR